MTTTPQTGLAAEIQSYLEALESRDVERCVSFYTDDATINFADGEYSGTDGIREWHEERFEANFHVTKIENISVKGQEVRVDLAVASNRLKAFKVKSLRSKGTFRFTDNKIREAVLSLASINPFALWQ